MPVQVHYNSWYSSLPSSAKQQLTWDDQILRWLEKVNHNNLFFVFLFRIESIRSIFNRGKFYYRQTHWIVPNKWEWKYILTERRPRRRRHRHTCVRSLIRWIDSWHATTPYYFRMRFLRCRHHNHYIAKYGKGKHGASDSSSSCVLGATTHANLYTDKLGMA